jgi:hypothetical protein
MPKTNATVRLRLIAEVVAEPEDAAADAEPVRFGGQITVKKGITHDQLQREMLALEMGVLEMMHKRGLFNLIEEAHA